MPNPSPYRRSLHDLICDVYAAEHALALRMYVDNLTSHSECITALTNADNVRTARADEITNTKDTQCETPTRTAHGIATPAEPVADASQETKQCAKRYTQHSPTTTRVTCDNHCHAVNEPITYDEVVAALDHWENHGDMNGCSHGC